MINGVISAALSHSGCRYNLQDLFVLRDADRVGNGKKGGVPKTFLDFKKRIEDILLIDSTLKVTDLNINGNDLINLLMIKPGPIIGKVLDYLLENVLDNPENNNKEILLKKAKEYFNNLKD